MIKKTVLTLSLLLFVGCGGSSGSGSGSSSPSVPAEEIMQEGIDYMAYPGDKIIKTSPNASVSITHIDGTSSRTTVRLTNGSATIKHR